MSDGPTLRAPEIDFDRFLPTRCCGIAVDRVFEFQTEKIIRVKSGVLGAIYFFACFFFFFYVVIYQILYRNEHFQLFDVEGTARVTIQQPTKNSCNPNKPDCEDDFRKLTSLSYCEVGTSAVAIAAHAAPPTAQQFNEFISNVKKKQSGPEMVRTTRTVLRHLPKPQEDGPELQQQEGPGPEAATVRRRKGLFIPRSVNIPAEDENVSSTGDEMNEEEREAYYSLVEQKQTAHGGNSFHAQSHGCIYADQHELVPQGMLSEQLFIPTRIDRHYEKLSCTPSKENGWHCKKRYVRVDDHGTEEKKGSDETQKGAKEKKTLLTSAGSKDEHSENVYVADIERFTILLAHTYHRGGYSGNSMGHQGFVEMCVKEGVRESGFKDLSRDELMRMIHPFGIEDKACPRGTVLKRVPIPCYQPGKCLFDKPKEGRTTQASIFQKTETMGEYFSHAGSFLRSLVFSRTRRNFEQKDDPWVQRMTKLLEDEAQAVQFRSDEEEDDEEGSTQASEKDEDHKEAEAEDEKNGEKLVKKVEERTKNGDFFALPNGDVFSLERLLALGGVDLDKQLNSEKETKREAGTLLEVSVEYRNLYPWWSTFHVYDESIEYTYRISERPVDEMKTEVYGVHQPNDYPSHRVIENRHGISINVRVGGTFGFMNLLYVVVMLTTSLVLLAAVRRGIDFLGLNLMKGKERYQAAKFEDIVL